MKIILTYDQPDIGKAEDTVDVKDEAVARRLLREGNARLAAEADLKKKES